MVRRFRALAMMPIIVLASLVAWGVFALPAQPVAAQSQVICSLTTPVPAGYVVTEAFTTSSCGSGRYNAYVIQQPYNGLSICLVGPLPTGYVVTEIWTTSMCGSLNYADVIRQPYDGISICLVGPLPTGYVITSSFPTSECSALHYASVIHRS